MIKSIKNIYLISSVVMSIFCSGESFGASFEIPSFPGSLTNHSSLASNLFEIEYRFKCIYVEQENAFPLTCGESVLSVSVSEKGSFIVPGTSVPIDPVSDPFDRRLEITAWIYVKETSLGYPFGFSEGDLMRINSAMMKKAGVPPAAVTQFTVFESAPQNLIISLKSGNFEKWFETIGRDLGKSFTLDFSNAASQPAPFEEYPYAVQVDSNGYSFKNWIQLPKKIYLVGGSWAANTPVKMRKWSYSDGKEIELTFAFAPRFPEFALTFDFDESAYSDPSALRTIAGVWMGGYIDLANEFEERLKIVEDQAYFTADLRCESGKISGTLIFRDGQTISSPETGRLPVNGTCAGEKAVLSFSLEEKAGGLLPVTLQIDRISAVKTRNWSSVNILSEDIAADELARHANHELTMHPALRLSDGKLAGSIALSLGADD